MSEPIRILQVGMSPNYGGTEAFVMEQYRHIDKSKVQFDFLNVFKEELACNAEIKDLGGRIFNLNMSRRDGMKKYHRNLDEFFESYHSEFKGIHCNYQSLINIDLLKYAREYGIPMRIAHAHNAGYGQEPNVMQKLIISLNKTSIKKYATHYFACSKLAAKWMFPKNTQATVIHNAIDACKFKFDVNTRASKRAELNITSDTFVVLFVGRLDPQKNPLFLIEIFEKITEKNNNSMLYIAGDGHMKGDVEALITQKGLADKVMLLGNRKDVNELMQAADAFLLPSKFEGLGIVLIEAQAAGLPCFASADVIPKDVDVTDTVRFISLNCGAEEWAFHILNDCAVNPTHPDYFEFIKEAGYDSKSNIKALIDIYCNYMSK